MTTLKSIHTTLTGFLTWAMIAMMTAGCAGDSATPARASSEQTLKGSLIDSATNRVDDIDKILLATATGKIWVHFPPHTARQVLAIAHSDTGLEVKIRDMHKPVAELSAIKAGHRSVVIADLRPPPPRTGKEVSVSGEVSSIKLDGHRHFSSFVVGKYLIDIPPPVSAQFSGLITQRTMVTVMGYQRSDHEGFQNITGLMMVRPYKITINKTDYLL